MTVGIHWGVYLGYVMRNRIKDWSPSRNLGACFCITVLNGCTNVYTHDPAACKFSRNRLYSRGELSVQFLEIFIMVWHILVLIYNYIHYYFWWICVCVCVYAQSYFYLGQRKTSDTAYSDPSTFFWHWLGNWKLWRLGAHSLAGPACDDIHISISLMIQL